jgi:hypothetical protein
MRKRVSLKSLVRENRSPGSVRGRLGNWPSYRDAAPVQQIAGRVDADLAAVMIKPDDDQLRGVGLGVLAAFLARHALAQAIFNRSRDALRHSFRVI